MTHLTFSGHDTFHCRQFWLKKAYDFLQGGSDFNDGDAPLKLGVGKNMVTAIRFWAKCFQVINENQESTELANKLLSDAGWDPYLEDHGTLWLLHYLLVTSGRSSTVHVVFNELIRQRPEFTADHFVRFIGQTREKEYNKNSVEKDFTVFYRTYFADFSDKDIEDSFTGILSELNLLKKLKKTVIDQDGKPKSHEAWVIERTTRPDVPSEVLLYAIISQHPNDVSLSFEQLYNDPNEIGCVFALNKDGLTDALENIASQFEGITFSSQAGVRELQFKQQLVADQILAGYYER